VRHGREFLWCQLKQICKRVAEFIVKMLLHRFGLSILVLFLFCLGAHAADDSAYGTVSGESGGKGDLVRWAHVSLIHAHQVLGRYYLIVNHGESSSPPCASLNEAINKSEAYVKEHGER
jgi:hypothetical protein